MKKLIAVLLILVLFLPSASLADSPFFTGCWVHTTMQTTDCPAVTFLCLREDHKCFFLIQSFREDEAGLGRTHVGTWDIEDGSVVAQIGGNVTIALRFNDDYSVAWDPYTLKFYIHTSMMIDGIMNNLLNQ